MDGNRFKSTCETNDYVPPEMICRHNKISKECTIISVMKNVNSPYKILIFKAID